MQVISINVGLPREIEWKGKIVTTAIFKQPVSGPVPLRTLNLDGDRQADLSVHGGPDKAVYGYSADHYASWADELPGVELPWGMFGENLTIQGLVEREVYVGDRFRVGSAELRVSQPRWPCYKLGLRFGDDQMLGRFLDSRRCGAYFTVLREGTVAAGDAVERIERDPRGLSVVDVLDLYLLGKHDLPAMHRAIAHPFLAEVWRGIFAARAARLERGQPEPD